MAKLSVGVLRGGPSSEYDTSLRSGAHVLRSLTTDWYQVRDIFIDRDGVWHMRGVPTTPERALHGVDVALNALCGEYGEDGTVQRILEKLSVPYTGSDAFASALAMHKVRAKECAVEAGLRTPQCIVFRVSEDYEKRLLDLFRSFPMPVVVKPVARGSSIGTSVAYGYTDLAESIARAFTHSNQVLIEEYIRGPEATVGVIDGFRGEEYYQTLPVEIVRPQGEMIITPELKGCGLAIGHCPSTFSHGIKQELQDAALCIHRALGARHYSRSDFIVSPRGVYFLETNTLPSLSQEAPLVQALTAAGSSLPELLEHVIVLARRGK
ncbi:hypothetical protein COU17_00435 [Candidatus Kaiserbacteria bacterium CG10_big_fil_rev_8_21_14_0_10_49_17]|uniref:ATP-grasp domain-containing protein n=1 Tax=Candidatus Kaiserbacteria bacterium CG10_big_fil_rev_8_21_14_0_10_49_17 TaxID=1974609 RepID=A0A2M6WFC5_9BACT|nr:MAG: hypothetical protein COU17_00435 [Candidatus Kaiserbacteria bacterium CG10_big_fil_rev_8_21_14_0_10_49_17]